MSRPRVLVIRFGALGDLVLATSLLPALRRERAHVTWVTKALWAPLLHHDDRVDRLVELESDAALGDVVAALDDVTFDRIVDAHATLRSRWLTLRLPPAPTVRLQKDSVARWLHVAGAPAPSVLDRRLIDRFHALVDGARSTDHPRIIVGTQTRSSASSSMDGDAAWLVVAPGAKHPAKQWPAERFAGVARAMVARTGCSLAIVGGPDDRDAVRTVASAIPDAVVLPEDRPLDQVAAWLERASLLLGNDSGLVHLAEAVGTPAVAVFGPTVRAWGYAPWDPRSRVVEQDVECRPCSKAGERACRQPEPWCLTRSTVDDVVEVVEEAWKNVAPDPPVPRSP